MAAATTLSRCWSSASRQAHQRRFRDAGPGVAPACRPVRLNPSAGGIRCSAAASAIQLHRWAFGGSIGAEHAAVTRLRAQQRPARPALVEELAGIGRHELFLRVAAVRAGDHRAQNGIHVVRSLPRSHGACQRWHAPRANPLASRDIAPSGELSIGPEWRGRLSGRCADEIIAGGHSGHGTRALARDCDGNLYDLCKRSCRPAAPRLASFTPTSGSASKGEWRWKQDCRFRNKFPNGTHRPRVPAAAQALRRAPARAATAPTAAGTPRRTSGDLQAL